MRQRLAVHDVLPPFLQVAFDHQPRDAGIATGDLLGHVGRHVDLAAVLLAAVGVGDIDHDLRAQACAFQQGAGGLHMLGAVVGLLAAAQDDVAVAIAASLEDGGLAHLGHAHEGVGRAGRLDGIAGHLDAAVRAVLEAHGAGQAAGQLAVALAFRGARADGAPADQVADELRRQQVQEFRAHGQAQGQHVQQQGAGHFQAFVDGEAAVQVRVVDVALPAHGGAGLLEVDAHDHEQLAGQGVGLGLELARIVHGLVVIVDGAGSDDDDEPVVPALQHVRDGGAAGFHQLLRGLGRGQPFLQQGRGDQGAHGLDAQVVDAGGVVRAQGHGTALYVGGGGHGAIVAP